MPFPYDPINKARWDHKCPHCETEIDWTRMYSAFEASDYKSEFAMDCPACEKEIEVYMEAVPQFGFLDPNRGKNW